MVSIGSNERRQVWYKDTNTSKNYAKQMTFIPSTISSPNCITSQNQVQTWVPTGPKHECLPGSNVSAYQAQTWVPTRLKRECLPGPKMSVYQVQTWVPSRPKYEYLKACKMLILSKDLFFITECFHPLSTCQEHKMQIGQQQPVRLAQRLRTGTYDWYT